MDTRLWISLSSLETSVLGFTRGEDVPGYLIPDLYFQYLQSEDARPLRIVLEHNRRDILSMVTLMDLVLDLYRAPKEIADPRLSLGIAKHLASSGDLCGAMQLYEGILGDGDRSGPHLAAMLQLARLYKRLDKWEEAAGLWQSLIGTPGLFSTEPFEELAKYFEHKTRDYPRAIEIVNEAIRRVSKSPLWRGQSEAELHRLNYRLERLNRKQAALQGHSQD